MTAVRLPAAQRRRQLLEVALSVFARRGYHETSMNDLAAEAGVTKPVLYQHFPSKGALYLELVDDVGGRLIDAIEEAAGDTVDARGQLVNGLRAYFSFVADQRRAFALLFGGSAPRDDELVHAVRAAEAAVSDAIAGILGDRIPAARRGEVTAAIVGVAEGTARHWAATGRRRTPDELAESAATLLWDGLGAIADAR